jgi:hypothetical protein
MSIYYPEETWLHDGEIVGNIIVGKFGTNYECHGFIIDPVAKINHSAERILDTHMDATIAIMRQLLDDIERQKEKYHDKNTQQEDTRSGGMESI